MNVQGILRKFKDGELDHIEEHINDIKNHGSEDELLELAEGCTAFGFMEEAKELYEQLLKLYPDEGELIVSIAEILTELDKEDEALLLLEKVSPEDPSFPSALLLEADLYQMQGMDEVSERKLLTAKKLLPEEIIIDFALGELFYQQGKFNEALQSYQTVLKQETEISGVNINQRIADSLGSIGQFEEALPFFEKALKDKLEINLLFEYGFTAYQAGNYKTAAEKLTELKNLDPEYHSLYLYLAKSHEHMNDLDEALSAAREGIRQDEFNKELSHFAGMMALKKGHEDEAENFFKNALALDPGYMETALNLLKLYLHQEKYEEILEVVDSVKQYGEYDPQFDWILASSHLALENYKEAADYFTEAYSSFKDNQDFLEEYGYFLIEEGKTKDAAEIFSKLLSLQPANDEYILTLERLNESML
ncbi:tetratricopeptide repeat protein [Peribacillus kribbensis]|uniref:tetratricopeptide repeat protein n=1 Tax=Peribacillus kribbensis TaxID=356658 RepID=UPI0003F4AE63|nr:tetratricopeptide repeat protein [Peribacillus kribbensis]